MSQNEAQNSKNSAALTSVLAAVGLTTFKVIVGVLTGSLGILAEAAHSGLDLVAAVMTWFAVRVADKPADPNHPFGHGKAENISALFETLLLLATSAWIIYEAAHRLMAPEIHVEVTLWSFVVMITSIVIDVNRSKMLMKAAREHNSQALEADALHFSTDIWSSAVVIVGLLGVAAAGFFPTVTWLEKADAVAALVVAVIVIFVSGELGFRSVQALIDAAPKNGEVDQIVAAARAVPGVLDVHAVRIRPSGAVWFVDLHIEVDGKKSVNTTHALTEKVEKAVKAILPRSDVTVHVEPFSGQKPA